MRVVVLMTAAVALSGCGGMGGLYGNDAFSQYTQRSDKITDSAGDTKEVNAAIHTNNPWPAYVGDRQIAGNGARAVKSIECHEKRAGSGTPTTRSQTNTSIDTKSGTASSQTNSVTRNECP